MTVTATGVGGRPAGPEWDEGAWDELERRLRAEMLAHPGEAWRMVVRRSRKVMRTFTTGFFIVSRFLPRPKRERVEIIYASVRYPDEVVDTFPLDAGERLARLDRWAAAYEQGLACAGLAERVRAGVPGLLAGFVQVVRDAGIPPEYYRSFLDAMRRDARPRPFASLEELVDDYVYGSAVVVGYFLTHVYGARSPEDFTRARTAARELGIGLQLTNFARDVAEDAGRGRLYLPLPFLEGEGVDPAEVLDPAREAAVSRAARRLADTADGYYRRAARDVDAFALDSRVAIRACIDVYGQLNERLRRDGRGLHSRASVPLREKLRPLPASKYWRLPWAYLESR